MSPLKRLLIACTQPTFLSNNAFAFAIVNRHSYSVVSPRTKRPSKRDSIVNVTRRESGNRLKNGLRHRHLSFQRIYLRSGLQVDLLPLIRWSYWSPLTSSYRRLTTYTASTPLLLHPSSTDVSPLLSTSPGLSVDLIYELNISMDITYYELDISMDNHM